jgi:amino acid transporter
VSPRWGVPVNAIILGAVLQSLLVLIYIGNTTAFSAFIALATIGMNLSYCLPIFLYLVYGRRNLKLAKGPFDLGKFGPAMNFIAVTWNVFLIVFLLFPSYQPATAVRTHEVLTDVGKYELLLRRLSFCIRICHGFVCSMGAESVSGSGSGDYCRITIQLTIVYLLLIAPCSS